MKTSAIILSVLIFLIFSIPACILIKGCNTAGNMIDNGFKTVEQQFSPSELLRKYEWFKDASSQCENKLATLKTYESRFRDMKQGYGSDSLKRRNWSRPDVEQWNVWESEYLGVKASYNDLAAEYNAAMVKFNYSFCNVGQLPQGAGVALPREFKPYLTN